MPNTKADPDSSPVVDARHQHRAALLQQLFAWTFTPERQDAADTSAHDDIRLILADLPELDAAIITVAPERPLADINKVDLAVLRLMLWEGKHRKTPPKVLVDEGIELAKEFGTENSPKFINATLARLLLE